MITEKTIGSSRAMLTCSSRHVLLDGDRRLQWRRLCCNMIDLAVKSELRHCRFPLSDAENPDFGKFYFVEALACSNTLVEVRNANQKSSVASAA